MTGGVVVNSTRLEAPEQFPEDGVPRSSKSLESSSLIVPVPTRKNKCVI